VEYEKAPACGGFFYANEHHQGPSRCSVAEVTLGAVVPGPHSADAAGRIAAIVEIPQPHRPRIETRHSGGGTVNEAYRSIALCARNRSNRQSGRQIAPSRHPWADGRRCKQRELAVRSRGGDTEAAAFVNLCDGRPNRAL